MTRPKPQPTRSDIESECTRVYNKQKKKIKRAYRDNGVIMCDYPLGADIDTNEKEGFTVLILHNPMTFHKLRYMMEYGFSTDPDNYYYRICDNKYCCRPSHVKCGTAGDTNIRIGCPGYLTWTVNNEKFYYKACTHDCSCKVITDMEDSELDDDQCPGIVKYNGKTYGVCTHKPPCHVYNVKKKEIVDVDDIDPLYAEDFWTDCDSEPKTNDYMEAKIEKLLEIEKNMTDEQREERRMQRYTESVLRNRKREITKEKHTRNRKKAKLSREESEEDSEEESEEDSEEESEEEPEKIHTRTRSQVQVRPTGFVGPGNYDKHPERYVFEY